MISPDVQVFMEHPMYQEEVRRKDQRLDSQMRSCCTSLCQGTVKYVRGQELEGMTHGVLREGLSGL